MKKTNNEQQTDSGQDTPEESAPNAYLAKCAKRLARGKKYGLRTEFRRDCELIMAILSPWTLSWKEASGWTPDDSYMESNGRVWTSVAS